MAKHRIDITEDPDGIVEMLLYLHRETLKFEVSRRVKKDVTKARKFLESNPVYEGIPLGFVEGCFRWKRPTSTDLKGFSLEGDSLQVGSRGNIKLDSDVSQIMNPQRIEFFATLIIVQGIRKFRRSRSLGGVPSQNRSQLNALRKEDPIVDFLLVNLIPPNQDFWKKHYAIRYLQSNPDATRKEIEKLGIRSKDDWDLITNYQKGMKEWIRAREKPKEMNFLSNQQYSQRVKKEVRMPDSTSQMDIESGGSRRQTSERQIFKSLHYNDYDFLH